MNIDNQLSPDEVLRELGRRIERRRLDLGLTQAAVADRAGLGKRTVERIEDGEDFQVSTLIGLLRVLDLMDGLDRLIPETGPGSSDALKPGGPLDRGARRPMLDATHEEGP